MTTELSPQCKIALALGAHKWPTLRQVALTVATRAILEIHQYGDFHSATYTLTRVSNRWRLGNYLTAMRQHYNF